MSTATVYPPDHRAIVDVLLGGQFLVEGDKLFVALRAEETFYRAFFEQSFGLRLELGTAFAVLAQESGMDTFSRDVILLLGCICHELAHQRLPIRASLRERSFDLAEWVDRLEESSFQRRLLGEVPALRDAEAKRKFFLKLGRLGIVQFDASKRAFYWTPAVGWFLEWVASFGESGVVGKP